MLAVPCCGEIHGRVFIFFRGLWPTTTPTATPTAPAPAEKPVFVLYARAGNPGEKLVDFIIRQIKKKEAEGFSVKLILNATTRAEQRVADMVGNQWNGKIYHSIVKWKLPDGRIDLSAGRARDEYIAAKLAAMPKGHCGVLIFGEVFYDHAKPKDKGGDQSLFTKLKNHGVPVVGIKFDKTKDKYVVYAR